jgi:hypothetical protein
MDKSKLNIIVALIFIGIGFYVIYDTYTDFAREGFASGNAEMNSAKYPRVLAGGLILLSILEIITTVRKMRVAKAEVEESSSIVNKKKHFGLALSTVAVFLAYITLVDVFGYFLTTPVMMFLMFLILGVRRIWEAAAFSLVTTVVLYILFAIGLELILPYGTIFS